MDKKPWTPSVLESSTNVPGPAQQRWKWQADGTSFDELKARRAELLETDLTTQSDELREEWTALITAMDDKVRATGEWQDRKSRAHSDASHEPQTLAELAALIGATEGEVAALDSFDFVRVMASLKLSLPTRAALQPLHARITSAAGSGVSESSLKWRKAVGAAADENRKAKHSQLRRAEFYRRVAGSDTLPPLKNADGNDTEAAEFELLPTAASSKKVIDECVRRLRASGDGGERDLDKVVVPGVDFVPTDGGGSFTSWCKDGKSRGIAEWALPKMPRALDGADRILFVHGGAYEYYSPNDEFYRPQIARLAKLTGLPVLSIDYRLAPEHKFPCALLDVLDGLKYAWAYGPDGAPAPARSVALIGDSAGGGLALASTIAILLAEGNGGVAVDGNNGVAVPVPSDCKLPTGVVALSAFNDLTASLPTYRTRAFNSETLHGDPVFSTGNSAAEISKDIAAARKSAYIGIGSDPRHPCASPLFAPPEVLAKLPPTLLQVGDAEVMLGETVDFAAAAVAAGAERLRLRIYPRMWHVFQFYSEGCGQGPPGTLKEAKAAMDEIRKFVHNLVPPPSADVDVEITQDVYATAFCLANNATPGMYSFWPWRNRQMWLIWFYLVFIALSQIFTLIALTLILPCSVTDEPHFVNCNRPTTKLYTLLGGSSADATVWAAATPQACAASDPDYCTTGAWPTLPPKLAARCESLDPVFDADVEGQPATFRLLTEETLFYENTFQGDFTLLILQLVCCVWVTVHVYLSEVVQVCSLFEFRDFNRWLLPQKGEELLDNDWVMAIPMLQFILACAVLAVSCSITCGADNAFDVVLNSLAFTFISEIPAMFNSVVGMHYASTAIAGLDPNEYGTEPIMYLVGEYDASMAYDELDKWDRSWYVKEEWQYAGLLSDYAIRHDPTAYRRVWSQRTTMIKLLFAISGLSPVFCYYWFSSE